MEKKGATKGKKQIKSTDRYSSRKEAYAHNDNDGSVFQKREGKGAERRGKKGGFQEERGKKRKASESREPYRTQYREGMQQKGKAGAEKKTEKQRQLREKISAKNQGQQRKKSGSGSRLCPVFQRCGGCQYLDVPYEKQIAEKRKMLEDLLRPYCRVKGFFAMENPWHYRNKVHGVFDHDRKGNVISGVYEANSHKVVPVESCLIEDQTADGIIQTIRTLLPSFKIRTFDEDTGYGLLRHVLIRRGFVTGEIMVVLVTASPVFPSKNNFVKALRQRHPEITTVIQNINGRDTSMVLGDREQVLYGKGYIEDILCGLRFRISSKSFYQVNPVQTEILYKKAEELAGLTGSERVIDAYCGIGTIGMIAGKDAKEVIGVELNADAVRDAVANAKLNQVKNIRFYCNDAGTFMVQMAEQGESADVVFMDPPRSGSTEEFIDSVARLGAKKVVYISCGPETLARDLKYFGKKGYKAVEAWGVDMFPMTMHVETVVLLSKGEIDSKKVRVEFSLEDMDMSGFQKGATYEQIKAYVLEKYGLKVSSLYISQVKRKCGLDVGQNYNLSKKEDAKVPQCPPEKEAAIMEALKHFHMV